MLSQEAYDNGFNNARSLLCASSATDWEGAWPARPTPSAFEFEVTV